MLSFGIPEEFIYTIYLAWVKFKLMCSISREHKMFFVFIFKNYIGFKGQQSFDDLFVLSRQSRLDNIIDEFHTNGDMSENDLRVLKYFFECDEEMILPITAFPLLFHNKESKMKYCNYKSKLIDQSFFHERVSEYIIGLDIKKLDIPPPDILWKIGNQNYNDGGTIRKDWERPHHVSSGFKYQKFIAQPLQPREIWVPGKAIKNNNMFWMIICKQILDQDCAYPSSDPEKVHERLKEYLGVGNQITHFDISGFGLQYERDILKAASTAIAELFPNSFLQEQTEVFHRILDTFDVEMPDGMRYHPNRGIGLGYYEDLKTIGIMAILLDHDVISLYGDQGLVCDSRHVDEHLLQKGNMILKPEKVSSADPDRLRWGGYTYTVDSYSIPRGFSNALLGAFFSREHWERKLALRGLYEEFPKIYRKLEKRLCFLYELFLGYEFFPGETQNNFFDCGITCSEPLKVGVHKLYKVQDMVAPYTTMPIDFKFTIPMVVSRDRTTPDSIAKAFSLKRKNTYNSTIEMDDSVYRYSRPRIIYNKKKVALKSSLPGWADALYASLYNCSTGVITFGLTPEELLLAARRQVYADNPFEAKARGGYSIVTRYRMPHCPTEEAIESSILLSELETRELSSATRADLHPSAKEGWDPIYQQSELVESRHYASKRKNREAFSEYSGLSQQEYHDLIYKKIRSLIQPEGEDLQRLNDLLRDRPLDFTNAVYAGSDHGAIEDELYEDLDYLDEIVQDLGL